MLNKVQPGDTFPLGKSENLNQVIEVANRVNHSGLPTGINPGGSQLPGWIRIYNDTGEKLSPPSVVELAGSHYGYEQNNELFRKHPVIKAVKPGGAGGIAKYAVIFRLVSSFRPVSSAPGKDR